MKTSNLVSSSVLEADHSRDPTPLSFQLQHPHAPSPAFYSHMPTIRECLASPLGQSHRRRQSFHDEVCLELLFVLSVSDHRLFRTYNIPWACIHPIPCARSPVPTSAPPTARLPCAQANMSVHPNPTRLTHLIHACSYRCFSSFAL
jgi:hypothetical protein